MTTRIHGGNINEAIKRYGLKRRTVLDFSSNVNPLGPSRAVTRAIREVAFLY